METTESHLFPSSSAERWSADALSPETLCFIREHRNDDVRMLALHASRYPGVAMREAIVQIAGWQIARVKVPSWAACEGILYPPHLSMEQSSSEVTARYKAEVIASQGEVDAGVLADLTGGFGIDCAFLSGAFHKVWYVERQELLCDIARHNFPLLGLNQIEVFRGDGTDVLRTLPPVDWLFLDPARRDGHGGKVVALADCEPDVCRLEPQLLAASRRVLLKLSPMLDLSLALNQLDHVAEVHVVAVAGECKEVLLLLAPEAGMLHPDDVPVRCVNLLPGNGRQELSFTRRTEQEASVSFSGKLRTYLYEPNAAVLKAGAFRTVAHRYQVEKLHPNTHLYTSDMLVPDFPGRIFRITASCRFGKRELKTLLGDSPRACLAVRNFPATVAELRKRLHLSDGGDRFLFATTVGEEKVLVEGRKVRQL